MFVAPSCKDSLAEVIVCQQSPLISDGSRKGVGKRACMRPIILPISIGSLQSPSLELRTCKDSHNPLCHVRYKHRPPHTAVYSEIIASHVLHLTEKMYTPSFVVVCIVES